jgi:hypothetical protein
MSLLANSHSLVPSNKGSQPARLTSLQPGQFVAAGLPRRSARSPRKNRLVILSARILRPKDLNPRVLLRINGNTEGLSSTANSANHTNSLKE